MQPCPDLLVLARPDTRSLHVAADVRFLRMDDCSLVSPYMSSRPTWSGSLRREIHDEKTIEMLTKPPSRATSLSVPSRSLPRPRSRTARFLSGFDFELATLSGAFESPPPKRSTRLRLSRPSPRTCITHLTIIRFKKPRLSSTNSRLTLVHSYNAKRRHWRKTRLGI